MTSRRLPHTPAAPRLDSAPGGDERRPACEGNPQPYDILMDFISGPEHRVALAEAKRICGSCPLQSTCLVENRDEPWAQAVTGTKWTKPPVTRDTCGSLGGYTSHRYRNEEPCQPCRVANARRTKDRKNRGFAA